MEYLNYLENFGKLVKSLRTSCKPKLSQVDFYKSLIPNSGKEDENIKKKMNKIENGKEKNIDLELLAAIQNKYDFSLDYIFGLTKDYTNYDNKHYCEYFGLDEKAIKNLHKLSLNKDFIENNFFTLANFCYLFSKTSQAWLALLYSTFSVLNRFFHNNKKPSLSDGF